MTKNAESKGYEVLDKYGKVLQCTMEKCKKEYEAINERQKLYSQDIEKLMQDTSLNAKIRMKKLEKLAHKLNSSVEKSNEIDCKLKHCYTETEEFIKAKVKKTLHDTNAPEWSKSIAQIYQKALDKGRITASDMKKVNKIMLTSQLQSGFKVANPVIKNLFAKDICTKKHCPGLQTKVLKQKKEFMAELNKIHADTKMSDADKNAKLEKLSRQYYDSPDRHKLLDCELGKCRTETEQLIAETVKLTKSMPNIPPSLKMAVDMLDTMLQNKSLTKEKLIQNDLKYMREAGYKIML